MLGFGENFMRKHIVVKLFQSSWPITKNQKNTSMEERCVRNKKDDEYHQ